MPKMAFKCQKWWLTFMKWTPGRTLRVDCMKKFGLPRGVSNSKLTAARAPAEQPATLMTLRSGMYCLRAATTPM